MHILVICCIFYLYLAIYNSSINTVSLTDCPLCLFQNSICCIGSTITIDGGVLLPQTVSGVTNAAKAQTNLVLPLSLSLLL